MNRPVLEMFVMRDGFFYKRAETINFLHIKQYNWCPIPNHIKYQFQKQKNLNENEKL